MRFPFLIVLFGSLAACGPDIPEPIWEGAHLHYSTTTSGPVCRGSFFRQEQHAVELARLLGFELPEIIQFTRVSEAEIPDYCDGLDPKGCAYVDSPFVFSVKSFHYHEVAHAVARLGGIGGALPFSEGFAEVFNDGGELETEQVPLDDVLRNFTLDDPNYYTAGLFARFLIERHGLETFVDFLHSTDLNASFAQFSPIFEGVFGEPLETAMVEFESYPTCSEMSNRIALVDCNLPLEPWEGQTVTLRANVACDQDDVLGPTGDDIMVTTRGFQVDEAGSYALVVSAPEGWSGVRLVRCGSCWDSREIPLEAGAMEVHDLTPGRYYALFGRQVDEPAELGLVIGKL
jgi:hypothetical protein